MVKTVIRDYQNSDWKEILDMIIQTMEYHISIQQPIRFHTYTRKLLSNFLRELTAKHRSGKGKLFVSENENHQLTGFIYGEIEQYGTEMKKSAVKSGTVDELYVVPEMRKKKVALELMKKLEEYFIKNKCKLIRVHDVHQSNFPAKHLYEKLGYIPRVIEYAKSV